MRLAQISYFLAVADCGNITKAAERLFISQPALSKQLSLMEEELGVRLLLRRARGIELTEAGKQYAEDCRKILAELDNAAERLQKFRDPKRKEINIGCFDGAVIDDFMPALYRHIRKEAPGIDIHLIRQPMLQNREALKADKIDLLVELTADMDYENVFTDCTKKELTFRRSALIYSVNSPLHEIKDLDILDFEKEPILVGKGLEVENIVQRQMKHFAELGLKNLRIEQCENFTTMMSNITMGYGYALLSPDAVKSNPDLRKYDMPDSFGMYVAAIWKKPSSFITQIMKTFPEVPEHKS